MDRLLHRSSSQRRNFHATTEENELGDMDNRTSRAASRERDSVEDAECNVSSEDEHKEVTQS